MLMFNCSFLSRLVPESNEIWYLGRTRTCLKELKVLSNKTTEKYQLNKPLLKKIENQIRLIFACTVTNNDFGQMLSLFSHFVQEANQIRYPRRTTMAPYLDVFLYKMAE